VLLFVEEILPALLGLLLYSHKKVQVKLASGISVAATGLQHRRVDTRLISQVPQSWNTAPMS